MMSALEHLRYHSSQFELTSYSLLKVTGADRETFLQGQVTSDVHSHTTGTAHLSARLNRLGKIQSFFFIAKSPLNLWLICPNEIREKIKNDLDKFIIMDDVEIVLDEKKIFVVFNPSLLVSASESQDFFETSFYGLPARMQFHSEKDCDQSNLDTIEELRILNGWPAWGRDTNDHQLLNENRLNQLAVSYSKGCFLGQETVAKIENNRGAAYYPVLLESLTAFELPVNVDLDFLIAKDHESRKGGVLRYKVGNFFQATLWREDRIEKSIITIKIGAQQLKVKVHYLPFFKSNTSSELGRELYHRGVEAFQQDKISKAKYYLIQAIAFDSSLADAYESMGVILGREQKYQEAIEWMDQLLSVNQQSVMAHTNKSLFLMKLGKIEEAEAEKSLATVKSFAFFGEESKLKNQLKAEEEKKKSEMLRREKMFLQVLDIDHEDNIALYGMADIYFYREEYNEAVAHLEKVISLDENYSTAYLLLGKCFEALAQTERARLIYQKGIPIASRKGELMPANEMQSRLNQIIMSSGLL